MKILPPSTGLIGLMLAGIAAPNLQAASGPASPNAPDVLPGQGLAQHDFFYAGEAKQERMFIVRHGEVVWSCTHNGRGEISDAVLLPNGNILFAHQFGVTEITAGKTVIWNYDAPPNTEIHTAQPLGTNRVWFVQNGDPAEFIVMNKATRKVEREFVLPVKNAKGIHGQFRHARLTAAGTVLVAHMDLGKAVEYDLDGKPLWAKEVPGIWSASPLGNGNVLAVSNRGFVREINRQVDPANPPVQALEVTPDKRIVWALRSWAAPADLGPATTIQVLE